MMVEGDRTAGCRMTALSRAGMAFFLLSALGGLFGCSQEISDPYSGMPSESPPPKPPECPETPELEDIRKADGSFADVRIIQLDTARLYIPTGWMVTHFVDDLRNPKPESLKLMLDQFEPDVHRIECPGIVHHAKVNAIADDGTERNTFAILLAARNPSLVEPRDSRFADEKLEFVSVQYSVFGDGRVVPSEDDRWRGWAQPHPAFFLVISQGWLSLSSLQEQDKVRAEMNRLGEWLLTAPKDRNEDEIFFNDIRS